jgi:hypothetical protein
MAAPAGTGRETRAQWRDRRAVATPARSSRPGMLAQPACPPEGREGGPASQRPARWEVALHLHVQHGHAELVVW